ncbi:MAG: hypothetical protein WA160_11380 [Pseudobdellovibrio sp.]
MKKQILLAAITVLAVSTSFAQKFVLGDITRKDELIIVNKNIVCSAYTLPADDLIPKKIVYGEFTSAVQIDDTFDISGHLEEDLFSLHGNINEGIVTISIQEHVDIQKKSASYSFSTTGNFTKEDGVVSLTVKYNGKFRSVTCSKK